MVWPSARRGVHPAAQDHAWPRSGGGCRSRRWSRSRRRGRRRRRIGTRQGYRKQREYDCLLHAGCAGNLRSSAKAMKYARSSATATKRCGCSDKSNVAAAQRDGPESLICSRRLSEAKGKCQKAKARSKQDVHVRVRVIRAGTPSSLVHQCGFEDGGKQGPTRFRNNEILSRQCLYHLYSPLRPGLSPRPST